MKTIERIASEGSKWDYDNHSDSTLMDAYIAGAKSERNQAIEEALDIINESFETTNADSILTYIDHHVKKLKV